MDDMEAGLPEVDPRPLSPEELEIQLEEQARQREERMQRLDILAMGLEGTLREHIGLRQNIEERWLADQRQYNGVYEPDVLERIKAREGSEVFINITRPKCTTAEARAVDLLFPNEDKNWGLRPTPMPKMASALEDQRPALGEDGQPTTVQQAARSIYEEAEKKCSAMEREIEDNLRESDYNQQARMCIHDSAVLGSGVLCGPIVTGRTRHAWVLENGMRVMRVVEDIRPEVRRVDPWNFVPDMSAATMQDARFAFERRYLHLPHMMRLVDDPYYMKSQLKRAIQKGAKDSHVISRHPTNEQRNNTDNADRGDGAQQTRQEAFEVWSYHGPVKVSDLRDADMELNFTEEEMRSPIAEFIAELEDEAEVSACLVFCNGIVIKAHVNPLDSGELPFSVFNYERDRACIFGFGVPYRMRNQQAVLNAAWRGLMDNTGLTILPQTVVNQGFLQPADGDWRITGGKTWKITDRNKTPNDVFGMFNIPSHQAELQGIIELSRRFIDDETNLPLITQGDQGTHITQTASGMSMLMNAANVVTRQIAKNWDDHVTTPLLGRFYDWQMQYGENEDIKGDFEVDARGSTIIMTRELETQSLMMMATQFAVNPLYAPLLKPEKLLRRIAKTMNAPADEILKSDDEIAAEKQQAEQAQQGQQQDPEVALRQFEHQAEMEILQAKAQNELAMDQQRHAARMEEAAANRELKMLELAIKEKLTVEQLRAKLADTRIKEQSKASLQMNEAAIKAQMGSGL